MVAYTWEQEFDEITLTIPTSALKPDIRIIPTLTSIKVYIKDELILDRLFPNTIIPSEVIWYFDSNLIIQITKSENKWWDCAFVGDTKIDVNEVANSRSVNMDGLDKDAKMAIDKMMYEQKCKAEGKESEEDKKKKEIMDLLKKNQQNN